VQGVSLDYCFAANANFATLLSANKDKIVNSLQDGFLTEFRTNIDEELWIAARKYSASNFMNGGD